MVHLVESDFSKSDTGLAILGVYIKYKKEKREKINFLLPIYVYWFGDDAYTGSKKEICVEMKMSWKNCKDFCDMWFQISGICSISTGDLDNCFICNNH